MQTIIGQNEIQVYSLLQKGRHSLLQNGVLLNCRVEKKVKIWKNEDFCSGFLISVPGVVRLLHIRPMVVILIPWFIIMVPHWCFSCDLKKEISKSTQSRKVEWPCLTVPHKMLSRTWHESSNGLMAIASFL